MCISVICLIAYQEILFNNIWTEATFSNNIKIVRSPKDYFTKSGQLQIMCEAEGNPQPSIVWYNAKTRKAIYHDKFIDLKIDSDQSLLTINNPKEKETYELYCNASNNNQWVVSKTVKTGLSFMSSYFLKQPPSIIIKKESETATISCQLPKGNPSPKSNWYKNEKPLITEKYIIPEDLQRFSLGNVESGNDRNSNNNCSLHISNLKPSDSGRYQCIANNDYYQLKSQVSWLLIINYFNNKIFDINIKQLFPKVGDNVEMLCDSNYKGNIRWISSNEYYLNIIDEKLLKNNIKLQDRGIYICETNETHPRLLNVFNLTISIGEAVEEKLKIQKKVVIEGVNVMLECDLKSSKTEFYWETPQSHPIFPNDNSHPRFRVNTDGYLNIMNAQYSDSGKYTCNVHSALDVKHKSIWLEVSKHQLDIYPIISLPAQNKTVLKGTSINLKCEVIGEDIIKIIWYSGMNIKERLTKNWQTSFPTKESLLIINAEKNQNTNFYTCEATNEQGLKSSWTAFVNIVDNPLEIQHKPFPDLPLPPVVESPKNIKSNSIELVWSTNINSKSKVFYWIEYVNFESKNGWEIYKRNWPYNSITIGNLKPDTWYQFLVRSKNDFGIGRASVPTEYVKTKNFMSDEPYSGNVGFHFTNIRLVDPEIVNGHEIKLKWLLNKDETDNDYKTSIYTQFYLNYKPVSILKCIVDKSNGNLYESVMIPTLNDYCSLAMINSEKLKMLKHKFSPKNEKMFLKPINFLKINISKFSQSSSINYAQVSWLMTNVSFFHCYKVYISSKNQYKTIDSNSKLILIPEFKPSRPPENIHVSWMLPDIAINIKWDLPDIQYWNGILTGSNIYMKSNESEIVLKFNDSLPNKIISQVNPNLNWLFRISLDNCIGEGEQSSPIMLHKLSDNILTKSEQRFTITNTQKINLFKKSWMIATLVITSVLIWLMLSFLTLYLCCSKSFKFNGLPFRNGKPNQLDESSNNKDFKDGLIINPMHNIEKDNEFEKDNEKLFNINNHSLSPTSSSSFCNPYASTQIFEPVSDSRILDSGVEYVRSNWIEPENRNLYYLSTPIFDASIINDAGQSSLNYFLSNTQEWIGHPNIHNQSTPNNLLPFCRYPSPDDCKTSQIDLNSDNKSSPRKDHSLELSVLKNNGTISNLLISTAPFSDQFTASSKSKSTNNSSNSDSSHHQNTTEPIPRLKKSNNQTKQIIKRRHDPGDFFDQSTEMTHLLASLPDKKSTFSTRESNRVYDIPYSDSQSITEKDK